MKKYVYLGVLLLLYPMLFSQKRAEKDSIECDYQWKKTIEKQDDKARTMAIEYPIVKKIHDTLGADYLEQHFYPNGNLYYQVPFKDGKKNGIYERYHPNGQLDCKLEMKDGYNLDSCGYITLDRFGDTSWVSLCIVYKRRIYSCQSFYIFGEPVTLMIYDLSKGRIHSYESLVAEFRCWRGKWGISNHHCRSVKYADELLEIYIKETGIGESYVKRKKKMQN